MLLGDYKHTRIDSVVAALAGTTVTVVVSQLIRGNAIARAIRNREGGSCKMTVTKLAVQPCIVLAVFRFTVAAET